MNVRGVISSELHPENAQRVSRQGSFDLPCSADTAFPLFSPEGEREWIKTWNPRPVFPANIEFCRDTVFREGKGSEEAIWTIVDADWNAHRAEYVRIAPASHAAHIIVKVLELSPGSSRVSIGYTVTAFAGHRSTLLAPFSEAAYADRMHNWQRRSARILRRGSNSQEKAR
jgi:hypothetical protein